MRANERVAQYLRLYSCSFQTTVHRRSTLVGDILCVAALFIVYFCMAATNRVFGILLIALRRRFPSASITALSSLSGVVSALPFAAAPLFSVLMNKGPVCRNGL